MYHFDMSHEALISLDAHGSFVVFRRERRQGQVSMKNCPEQHFCRLTGSSCHFRAGSQIFPSKSG